MTTAQENNELLNMMLDKRFFSTWKKYFNQESTIPTQSYDLISNTCLELFITPTCNQNCEYCYLVKNPGLYPKEINNQEQIKENLLKVLQWIEFNRFCIPKIDLFSGEIWHTKFGLEILDIDKEQTQKIQHYINLFSSIGISLTFSASIDGKIIEDQSRPFNDGSKKDDEFYENLFIFAKRNSFGFHPMISAQNVKYWIDNYKWWESMCDKYTLNSITDIMMLEVRSKDWDEEAIQDYKKFIEFLFKKNFNILNNNPKDYFLYLIGSEEFANYGNYMPYLLVTSRNTPTCGIIDNLTIRLGDLAIAPCHRTSYTKYLYGKFIEEDGKLSQIEAINPYMAMRILYMNNISGCLFCDTCNFNSVCLRGCFGNQIEENNDPFMPIEECCIFFKEKYKFLLELYKKYGLLDVAQKISKDTPHYDRIEIILSLAKKEGIL